MRNNVYHYRKYVKTYRVNTKFASVRHNGTESENGFMNFRKCIESSAKGNVRNDHIFCLVSKYNRFFKNYF